MRSTVSGMSVALLLFGALGLAVAGCGGSGKSTTSSGAGTTSPTGTSATSAGTSTTTSTSSRPSQPGTPFIARAEAICARINAELLAHRAKSASAAEVKRVVPKAIATERRGVDVLASLAPPPSLAADWQRMLGYRRELAKLLGGLLAAAKKNERSAIAPLAASKKRVHAQLTKTAKADGFKDCAKVGRVG